METGDGGKLDEAVAYNKAAWDERVALHVDSAYYDNESFKAGRNALRSFERDEVGDVTGKTLCHLQCHFGQDTLSWARLGASVVGLDFSEAAVDAARDLAAELDLEAEFVCSNVYDAVGALGSRQFDIVYTGIGALCWLPDIPRWAQACAELVAPGATFYLAEMHPITEVMADEDLVAVNDYFPSREGTRMEGPGSYADWAAPTENNTTYEWTHPVSEVIGALLDAGLQLELFHEHDFTLFERWRFLVVGEDFIWRMPADRPRLPLLYSIRMTKPV
ncbi:MAG: class I SAM-dependent methyltransferase [Actinobacteria bacterium]|nr:class I SAM-dependent methyltransferase [Actinomycetota bacterium]